MNHEAKKEETNLEVSPRINADVLLQNVPVDELLGSVTTYPEGNDKNQTLRSSARVFKKIKLDANLLNAATTVEKPGTEKKEEPKSDLTSQKEQRKLNISWITEEITALFFEALNEYGKDFENIHSYITQKLKKKGATDQFSKDHVRHLYYRTWHKISKFLKFSDGVKKTVQELYGLINYGELRKKITTSRKIYYKLNELIHLGCVTLRVKGKMVRVRTPMCPALRRLNKLDDKDDDLKLPTRVVIQLQPRDMHSFFKVQSFALNPRIQTVLPLQKKLSTFINCVSKRWKSAELEYVKNNYPKDEMLIGEKDEAELDIEARLVTSQLKFTPPRGTKLNLARTDISDSITRENICLNAYEERMGIDSTKLSEKKDCKKSTQKARSDSFSETIAKIPVKTEVKDVEQILPKQNEIEDVPPQNALNFLQNTVENQSFQKVIGENVFPPNTVDETVKDECQNHAKNNDNLDLLAVPSTSKPIKVKKEIECLDNAHQTDLNNTHVDKFQSASKSDEILDNNKNNKHISVEEQFSKLVEIRNGWTVEDCDNLTIGELYLMFGSASKLVLEYYWVDKVTPNTNEEFEHSTLEAKPNIPSENLQNNFGFTDTLRKLVDVMKMQQKKPSPKCSCGHVCSPKSVSTKKTIIKAAEVEEKLGENEIVMEIDAPQSSINGDDPKKNVLFDDFVRPQCKPPPVHLIAQLDSIEKLKPKYTIRKGRRLRTQQLVVERELPLMPKASSGHQIVRMNIISQQSNGSNTSDQPIISSEGQEMNTVMVERDIDNNFDRILCMKENQLPDEMDMPMNVDGTPGECRANNLEAFLDTARSLSPSVILKENEHQWISSEVADFSLSSFLGHLESPMKSHDDVSHDVDCQLRSLLTENSFDYTAKFADLANKVVGDAAN